MKLANIIYNKRIGRINLGDDIQIIAMQHLLETCFEEKDIVRLEVSELWNWSGEQLLVPISFPLISYHDFKITCFSKDIVPIFIALSILTDNLCEEDIRYLSKFSPIGCRDFHTYHIMKKYNIPAYVYGCVTLTLPLREVVNGEGNVYAIDISAKLEEYIPEKIKEKMIRHTNVRYANILSKTPEEETYEVYQEYRKKAMLIITSRMHVALPCMAMGIPTIFAKDEYSYRFDGISRYIKIYDSEEYSKIDWNPKPILYEQEKKKLINCVTERIKYALTLHKDINEIMNLYSEVVFTDNIENRNALERFIKKEYKKNDRFLYILWSVTQTASMVHSYIDCNFPKAELVAVIDRSKEGCFEGINIKKKEQILEYRQAMVFVCSDAAIEEAKDFLEKNNIQNYFFVCQNGMKI